MRAQMKAFVPEATYLSMLTDVTVSLLPLQEKLWTGDKYCIPNTVAVAARVVDAIIAKANGVEE